MNKIILVYGDLEAGLTFHGPFEDVIEAKAYQQKVYPGWEDDCATYLLQKKPIKNLTK
jgi:hypothetical protein